MLSNEVSEAIATLPSLLLLNRVDLCFVDSIKLLARGGEVPTTHELPLVSIVVPVYNHERYIGATIDSLMAQSYPNLELVIVNDGSSDSSLEVLEARRFDCERRFKRFVLIDQINSGVATALNRGIQEARAAFVFLLSSDDLVERDAIESLLPQIVLDPSVALVCGDADFIDANGAPLALERNGIRYSSFTRFCLSWREQVDITSEFGNYRSLIIGNYLPVGILLRRECIIEVGGYDPNCAVDDHDLWLKLAKNYRFKFVDRALSHYRRHGQNTILTKAHQIKFDQLLLMVREAEFCAEQGLTEIWRTSMKNMLFEYRHQRDDTLRQLTDQFVRLQEQVRHAERERDELAGREAALRENAEHSESLTAALADLQNRILRMKRSYSWTLTSPLREIRRAGLKLERYFRGT
jgi:alpha-1,3-rhamnosyltransferase